MKTSDTGMIRDRTGNITYYMFKNKKRSKNEEGSKSISKATGQV